MCIRDRKQGLTEYDRLLQKVAQGERQARQDVASYLFNKGCLLYTSDAADERSSVDLGGRRIIKKKNILECSAFAR